jgi:hypothetical protein
LTGFLEKMTVFLKTKFMVLQHSAFFLVKVSPMILATNHDIGPAILCGNGLTLLLDGSVTVLQSTPIGFLQRAHRLKSGLMPPQFLHTA